ncbi:MAG TPA: site-2 protease family protein [Tepidisphaeraceae bacterium]|jgi:Zn-dependent protease
MMIQLLQSDPGRYFAIVLVVVVSIVIHELAHGVAAVWLGDRTPIETGHMTLNPVVHMGGFSLVMLALVGIAWGQMPVNPSRMRGKYADLLVSAAGPASNLLLAILGLVVIGILVWAKAFSSDSPVAANGLMLLVELVRLNFALLLLNLIPVPPLDGSRMLANVSPAYRRAMSGEMARGITMAALFAIFLGGGQYIFGAAEYATFQGIALVTGQR